MPITIDGKIYYRTQEVCQIIGISKSTLFHLVNENALEGIIKRDWLEWKLFSISQVEEIKRRTT